LDTRPDVHDTSLIAKGIVPRQRKGTKIGALKGIRGTSRSLARTFEYNARPDLGMRHTVRYYALPYPSPTLDWLWAGGTKTQILSLRSHFLVIESEGVRMDWLVILTCDHLTH